MAGWEFSELVRRDPHAEPPSARHLYQMDKYRWDVPTVTSTFNCVFCDIWDNLGKDTSTKVVEQWQDVIAIVPLNPVTYGHVLIIPRYHVRDFSENPYVTGFTMEAAAIYWRTVGEGGDANLITSKGEAATQTVGHLHVHVVPRRLGDGLHLPWMTPGDELHG